MTIGIFLPAFSFTLLGHNFFERLVDHPVAHVTLDGITAGVVGLIAATSLVLGLAALAPMGSPDAFALLIFVVAMAILIAWRSRVAVAAAVMGGGALGLLRTLLLLLWAGGS